MLLTFNDWVQAGEGYFHIVEAQMHVASLVILSAFNLWSGLRS